MALHRAALAYRVHLLVRARLHVHLPTTGAQNEARNTRNDTIRRSEDVRRGAKSKLRPFSTLSERRLTETHSAISIALVSLSSHLPEVGAQETGEVGVHAAFHGHAVVHHVHL